DCIQEGLSGLIIAARKYDPEHSKGRNKFSTMAHPWIGQAISRGVNSTAKLVRLPENRVIDYSKIIQVEQHIQTNNLDLSAEELEQEIIKATGLTREYIYAIRNASASHYSLNRTVGDEENDS